MRGESQFLSIGGFHEGQHPSRLGQINQGGYDLPLAQSQISPHGWRGEHGQRKATASHGSATQQRQRGLRQAIQVATGQGGQHSRHRSRGGFLVQDVRLTRDQQVYALDDQSRQAVTELVDAIHHLGR